MSLLYLCISIPTLEIGSIDKHLLSTVHVLITALGGVMMNNKTGPAGREGEGGTNWKIRIDIHALMCKTES